MGDSDRGYEDVSPTSQTDYVPAPGAPQRVLDPRDKLAVEILIEQTKRESLDRIWAAASEEGKRALADEVLTKLLFIINEDGSDYTYRNFVSQAVAELLETKKAIVMEKVEARIEANIDEMVEEIYVSVRRELKAAMLELLKKLKRGY